MITLSSADFARARQFVLKKARPVDRALFAYTFDGGSPSAVRDALAAFANSDGGFGNALEPDCRLPDSSALATTTAFPYLIATGAPADHPLVRNAIAYLVRTCRLPQAGWYMLPPAVNNYPRAAWWNHNPEEAAKDLEEHWANPSAAATAYLYRYRELVPPDLMRALLARALSMVSNQPSSIVGHEFLTFVELAEALPPELAAPVWTVLKQQAMTAIETDPANWSGYGIRPLWAVQTPDSPLMSVLGDAVAAHLEFEIARQHDDGSWHTFWSWGQFDAEWEVAKVEWQGQLTVKLLRTLHALGRIAGAG